MPAAVLLLLALLGLGLDLAVAQTPCDDVGTCSERNAAFAWERGLMCGTCSGGTCEAEATASQLRQGTRCNAPGVEAPGRCRDEASDDTMSSGYFACVCQPGFEGVLCLTDIDECEAEPCQNEGTCSDSTTVDEDGAPVGVEPNSFACACTTGYEGDSCEHDVDECGARPCINGDCTESFTDDSVPLGQYLCSCYAGWSGANCDIDIDECHTAALTCAETSIVDSTCTDATRFTSAVQCPDDAAAMCAATDRRSAWTAIFFLGDCAVDVMVGDERKSLAAVNDVPLSTLFRAANQCCGDTIVTTVEMIAENFEGILQLAGAPVSDDAPVALTFVDGTVSSSVAFTVENQDAVNDQWRVPWSLAGLSLDSALCSFSPASLCEIALDVACSSVTALDDSTACESAASGNCVYIGVADGTDASCSGTSTAVCVFTAAVTSPCDNAAPCTDSHDDADGIAKGDYVCECSAGWGGQNCVSSPDYPLSIISERVHGSACCPSVLKLLWSQGTDIDDCASNPCGDNSVCTNELSAFSCSCLDGWADATPEDLVLAHVDGSTTTTVRIHVQANLPTVDIAAAVLNSLLVNAEGTACLGDSCSIVYAISELVEVTIRCRKFHSFHSSHMP